MHQGLVEDRFRRSPLLLPYIRDRLHALEDNAWTIEAILFEEYELMLGLQPSRPFTSGRSAVGLEKALANLDVFISSIHCVIDGLHNALNSILAQEQHNQPPVQHQLPAPAPNCPQPQLHPGPLFQGNLQQASIARANEWMQRHDNNAHERHHQLIHSREPQPLPAATAHPGHHVEPQGNLSQEHPTLPTTTHQFGPLLNRTGVNDRAGNASTTDASVVNAIRAEQQSHPSPTVHADPDPEHQRKEGHTPRIPMLEQRAQGVLPVQEGQNGYQDVGRQDPAQTDREGRVAVSPNHIWKSRSEASIGSSIIVELKGLNLRSFPRTKINGILFVTGRVQRGPVYLDHLDVPLGLRIHPAQSHIGTITKQLGGPWVQIIDIPFAGDAAHSGLDIRLDICEHGYKLFFNGRFSAFISAVPRARNITGVCYLVEKTNREIPFRGHLLAEVMSVTEANIRHPTTGCIEYTWTAVGAGAHSQPTN
ncbi:uncharacterized protein BDV17DRAFT_294579 [Aspergillus undulatus]|uniref:uncharacterized protein n=1 Tax=Aspergillus undulatus TaxID=1810928 RepID=UPI003CCC93BC